ncbi:MAG: hypothetical protein ACRERE_08725 [Candidatus Entotheonellia bacterium]
MPNNRSRRPVPAANPKPYEPTEDQLQGPPKKFAYELWMFREALRFFLHPAPRNEALHNICLEATLLHARNLLDFFTGKPPLKDDIRAAHFLPQSVRTEQGNWWTSSKLAQLQKRERDINKSLSHLTYTRVDEKPVWDDLAQIGEEIEAAYREFRELLPDKDRVAWPA